MYDISQLKKKLLPELQEISEKLNISNFKKLKKTDLIYEILDKQSVEKKNDSDEKKNDSFESKKREKFQKKTYQNTKKTSDDKIQNVSHQNFRRKEYDLDGNIYGEGVLEVMPDGYGFIRSSDYNYLNSPDDIYVSQSQIKLFGLKTGDTICGQLRPPKEGEKYFPLVKVEKINNLDPRDIRDRVSFKHKTPLFPEEKFQLAKNSKTISTRYTS